MKSRVAVAASLVVVCTSLVLLSRSPAEAAAFGARLSQNPPIAGEVVHVAGKVPPAKRRVVLQRASGGRWVAVSTKSTAAAGSYTFDVRASKVAQRYRVSAPAVKVKGKKYAARVSNVVRVLGVAPSLTMSLVPAPAGRSTAGIAAAPSDADAQTPGAATFRPARPGALVTVRRWDLATGHWVTAATARQNSAGNAYFQLWAGSADSPQTFQAVSTSGGATAVSTNVRPTYWTSSFDDEFTNGTSNWTSRASHTSSSTTCSMPTPEMFTVSDGLATLQAQRVEAPSSQCPHGFWHYAALGTANSYTATSGVFAARIKFQSAPGAHGAFWLQRTGDAGNEIDVAEYFGAGRSDGGISNGAYATLTDDQTGGIHPASKSILGAGHTPDNSWHVYSVDWTAARYVFRIDGVPIFSTTSYVSQAPEELMLSLATSDWELPKMPSTTTSTTMKVDWVRGWTPGS